MDNSIRMQVLQPQQNANNQKFGFLFFEFLSRKMESKISSWQVVKQKIEILTVLMGIQ